MFGSYSFKDVNVILGIDEVTGWADGDDCFSVEPSQDLYTKVVGAKGDVVRSASNDYSVVVTIKLLQESEFNAKLNAIRIADAEAGLGVIPIIYNNSNTGESYIIQNAWLAQMPTVTRGRNQNNMEWVLHGDKAEFLKEA